MVGSYSLWWWFDLGKQLWIELDRKKKTHSFGHHLLNSTLETLAVIFAGSFTKYLSITVYFWPYNCEVNMFIRWSQTIPVLLGMEGKRAGQWRVQPSSCLTLGILMYSNVTFGSLLSEGWGKQGHIKKSGDECKVFIYIFLQHNCNRIFIEHCSTK